MPLWKALNSIHIGYISKPHSYLGWARVAIFISGLRRVVKPGKFIFIHFQEKPVPFLIEAIRWMDDKTLLIKFEGVDSEKEAGDISERDIYIAETELSKKHRKEASGLQILGFNVYTRDDILLGEVVDLIEETAQPLLEVKNGDREVLIPYHNDFIIKVNHSKKLILVHLPEGFLDI
ncbi:MAG: ribosome maturation factor RimM [Bacteroidota bacterium]|nr:ribosome maturation factor RimM [Bacteroidota bacterium]